jgi:hypothetical protein
VQLSEPARASWFTPIAARLGATRNRVVAVVDRRPQLEQPIRVCAQPSCTNMERAPVSAVVVSRPEPRLPAPLALACRARRCASSGVKFRGRGAQLRHKERLPASSSSSFRGRRSAGTELLSWHTGRTRHARIKMELPGLLPGETLPSEILLSVSEKAFVPIKYRNCDFFSVC